MLLMWKEPPAVASSDPKQNHFLAALPELNYKRLLPDLELISMPLEWPLAESYLYFPTTSIVALLHVMENGASGEVAIIGNEGVVGLSSFMGGESSPSRAVVQSTGYGYRIKSNILEREFALGGRFQQLALRFTQALIVQLSQTAICNRHHTVSQQLCRLLLMSLDPTTRKLTMLTYADIDGRLGDA